MSQRRNRKKGARYELDSHFEKSTPFTNNLTVDRNFNCCKIHSLILFYKWSYNNTEIHKNKKEQFKSKKLLTEINVYFDDYETHQSAFCVFSMKFLKRNYINGFLFLAEIVHSIG